jgi:hypothetical protein
MLKKGNGVKCIAESTSSFDQIKRALNEAPVLINPEYSKKFFIQKNAEGLEKPISFFNKALMEAEMEYNIVEK